jgi:predicted dehydrogenase
VGLIGLGQIGGVHARALATSERAEFIVCCDWNPAREAACPQGVPFTTSVEEALDTPGLEAVVVATPEDSHRSLVEAALARSLTVLCEKPIAGTLEDAEAMIDAAAASSVALCVGHCAHFEPRYQALQREVESGALGSAIHLTARRVSHTGERDYYGHRTSLAVELAIHDLDLLRWLAGPIERVYCEAADTGIGEAVASLVATLRFRSGAIGTLESSWAYPEDCGVVFEDGLVFVGTQGFARVDGHGLAVHTRLGSRLSARSSATEPSAADAVIALQAECFLTSVRDSRSWPLRLSDALAALAAATALNTSIESGRPVEIECRPHGKAQ